MPILEHASRKWTAWRSYGLREKLLVLPSLALLGTARLMIGLLPFRAYAGLFGQPCKTAQAHASVAPNRRHRVRAIGRAVRMSAKITPWTSLCLVQAICACSLLRLSRVPYTVHFGVKPGKQEHGNDPLQAHVWVIAGKSFVTGGLGHEVHTVVSTFIFRPRTGRR